MIKINQKILFTIIFLVVFLSLTTAQEKNYTINQLMGKEKIALYGKDFKLQKEAYIALNKMIKSAKKQGIIINVVSSFRGFNHQNRIWNRKYNLFKSQGHSSKSAVKKVMEYTAIPGTSRHHWGTDVDISNSKGNLSNYNPKQYRKWLDSNAHKFGFYLSYTKNQLRGGYNYESWHFSYRNLAKPMLEQYIEKNCLNKLKNMNISGSKNFTVDYFKNFAKQNVLEINNYLY